MTLMQKYYAMNSAINTFLENINEVARVYKYGVVVEGKYPYFQAAYPRVTYTQPYASTTSGTLTEFEYRLNFFTAAKNEKSNDSDLFDVFEKVKEGICDPGYFIFRDIVNVLKVDRIPTLTYKSGMFVIQTGLVLSCSTVCSHLLAFTGVNSTIDNSVAVATEELTFEE